MLYPLILLTLCQRLFSCLTYGYSPTEPRQMSCDIAQKGFHLNLRCMLSGAPIEHLDRCVVKLRLSRELFVDPYELSIRRPGLKFSLSKPKEPEKSRIGRWLSWLTNSAKDQSADETPPTSRAVAINKSDVDIESPQWQAHPLTVRIYPESVPNTDRKQNGSMLIDLPLHLRYNLPSDGSTADGDTRSVVQVPHPIMKCGESEDMIPWEDMPPFEVTVPTPSINDLLLVLPITILLLVVGMIVLLVA